MFDAILFDNDGVLVDTEHLYFRANQEALAGVGIQLDADAYVQLFLREGRGAWHLARERGLGPADIDALRAARDRRYFELVLAQGDYARGKPEPDPYLRAVERLGVEGDRCLVIEDSERGLRAAKAAGLRCWVIPSGLTAGGRFEKADAVFDSLGAAAVRLLA